MKSEERIILGIDPGTTIMGYGIISASKPKPKVLAIGVVNLKKYTDHYVTIKTIYEKTMSLIEQYLPDELAIEAPFYGKNIQSMLKLGRAQGAAISAALNRDLPIFEYAPRKIKMAITGNGNASKEQVAAFLSSYLKLEDVPDSLDATDGLAAAVCHYFQKKVGTDDKNYKSWKDFMAKNPGRVKQ